MTVMQSRDTRTEIAGEDLSAAQFHFVTLESDGQVNLADSAGELCYGVLLVGNSTGRAVTVVRSGSVMVEAGGTISAGGAVSTNAAGEAIAATTGHIIMGYAKESAVDGQLIEIELITGGNASA